MTHEERAGSTTSPADRVLNIAAVGDILMWAAQIETAKLNGGDGYDFDYVFESVKPLLDSADLAIGNLETTLSGPGEIWQGRQKMGAPLFNCPDELAGALKRAGFDVLTTANNHTLDCGLAGLNRTLDVLDEHGLAHTGSFRTPSDAVAPLVVVVNGVRVGIVAATYGTNGIPVPAKSPWSVNLLDGDLDQAVRSARDAADVVIASLHFGREFDVEPSAQQRSLAMRCFENGAHVVLGAHPHVLQAVEHVGDNLVCYSLGNFSSKHMKTFATICGAVVRIQVTVSETGTRVTGWDAVPTMTSRIRRHRIIRLDEDHAYESREDEAVRAKALAHIATVLGRDAVVGREGVKSSVPAPSRNLTGRGTMKTRGGR